MTVRMEAEREICRLAAQILSSKNYRGLTEKEQEMVGLLEKHSYLKPRSNGFVGSVTNKVLHQAGSTNEG